MLAALRAVADAHCLGVNLATFVAAITMSWADRQMGRRSTLEANSSGVATGLVAASTARLVSHQASTSKEQVSGGAVRKQCCGREGHSRPPPPLFLPTRGDDTLFELCRVGLYVSGPRTSISFPVTSLITRRLPSGSARCTN
jgi:hypothetical protein